MKIRSLCILAACLCTCVSWAQSVAISGKVIDNEGKAMPYATIVETGTSNGLSADENGKFTLTVNAGKVNISASSVGFEKTNVKFIVSRDTSITITCESYRNLNQVEIISDRNGSPVDRIQMSAVLLDAEQIKRMPSLFGEADLIRTLTFLPGVSNGNEGNMGFYVRGGSADQNLILMDGVPIYNASHILGFFSLFNPETMKSVNLIKGGFPARFGGRLASVTEITMKQGDNQKYSLEGGVGLLTAKATVQGPLWKGKTSFLVAGRSAYINLIAKPAMQILNSSGSGDPSNSKINEKIYPGFSFFDINLNLQHIFNDKTKIWSTNYWGRDRIDSRVENPQFNKTGNYVFDMNWQTRIASLNLQHKFRNDLSLFATSSYTDFDYRTQQSNVDVFHSDSSVSATVNNYFSRIRDVNLKLMLLWQPGKINSFRFGAHVVYHDFLSDANIVKMDRFPGNAKPDADANRVYGTEYNAFVEDEINLFNRVKLGLGVHLGTYRLPQKWYWTIQPRFGLNMIISENWSFKASYSQMMQPMHMLTNYGIGLPTDLWVAATPRFAPQQSHDVTAGIQAAYKILGSPFEFSVEGFYRKSKNVLEYKNGAGFSGSHTNWEDLVEQGTGESYGMEVFIQKNGKIISGWVGYTLSWSWRQFDNINLGEKFPYRYDRRHAVNIVVNIKLPRNISLTATWLYGTGNAITLATEEYNGIFPSPWGNFSANGFGADVQDLTKRNNFRMQDYHRMDLGLNFHKAKKWGTRTWSVGIYNVYCRQNPYLYFLNEEDDGSESLRKLSLFPIIPTVSYNFKFDRIPPKGERKLKKRK